MARVRGLSLAETVMALFLLVAGIMVVAQLLHSGLRHGARTEQQATATLLAERRVEEIRTWAAQGANFAGDWSSFDGVTVSDPEFPGHSIRSEVADVVLYSPDALIEQNFPASDRRGLPSACKKVAVEVRWDGLDPLKRVRLVTLVGRPTPLWHATNPIRISPPGPHALGHDATLDLEATAFDADDNPIDDVFFEWSIEPLSGAALVASQSRDGKTAEILNRVYLPDGTAAWTAGSCRAVARATLHGRGRAGFVDLNLAP